MNTLEYILISALGILLTSNVIVIINLFKSIGLVEVNVEKSLNDMKLCLSDNYVKIESCDGKMKENTRAHEKHLDKINENSGMINRIKGKLNDGLDGAIVAFTKKRGK